MSLLLLERETCLGHWIETQLLRDTESLSLQGKGAKIVDLSRSPNIKWLSLSKCETTKNIITTPSNDNVDGTVFPASLEHMDLYSLPLLQEVSCTSLQNLSSIIITDCPRLPNLSIACLSQLEMLRIEGCEMMEQVFLWKEKDNNRMNPYVKFPKLKDIRLYSLPNLVTFCQGIEGIEFPLLRKIRIKKCPKWTSMVSNEDIHDLYYSAHLFCKLGKVSFGNLKELVTNLNPFCGHEIPVSSSSYSGLERLNISRYGRSKSLLSSTIARNLVNLKTLVIEECDEMVQVIKDDDDEEDKTRRISANTDGAERAAPLFPKLEVLHIMNLPKLGSFCELKCVDVVLPSLRRATIHHCPNMKNLSLVAPNLEDFTTDFNYELEVNVSFGRLKKLSIENMGNVEYPSYHHKFFISLLDGLEVLKLYRHESMSLFSCSMAGKLVNLKSLWINNCHEMVNVIEDDEVESSGGTPTLLFPKLEELELVCLPKLVSFFGSQKCVLELPCLTNVDIFNCPNLKRFSFGPLTTAPNLKSMRTYVGASVG